MSMSEGAAAGVHARTSDVPEPERFDYFREAVSDVYLGIRTEWSGDGSFDAVYDAYPIGGDVLGHMWTPGCAGRRGASLVRRRPDEAVYLNLSMTASHTVDHLDRVREVGRGMPMALDSESPFLVDFTRRERFRLYTLRVEKGEGFAPSRREVRRINEQLAHTAPGRALARQYRLLCSEVEAGRPEVAATMGAAIRALLGVLTGTLADSADRLEEFKVLARGRLATVGLRADDVGAAFGVSGRTVQAEFQASGETFSDWLLAERLELARDRLVDPAWRTRTIGAIAAASGFRDPAHFHRVFRGRFAMTPGDARRVG